MSIACPRSRKKGVCLCWTSILNTKCRPCEKNKWPCIGLPGRTCNERMKAKAKCDKLLGWIGRRKDTKVVDTKGKAPGEWLALCVPSAANWIVVRSTGAVIWILPLQPVVSTSTIVLPATPLFLEDSSSLPKIETLQVDESKADSALCKRLKTGNANKERTTKIAKARLTIAMCESQVHSAQAFLKDLEVQSSQIARFIGEQIGELERLKGILDGMDEMWGTQSRCVDSSQRTPCK